MKEIILLKYGELALKGLNRSTFEDMLVRNIKWRIGELGAFKITRAQSTMRLEPEAEGIDLDEAVERLCRVFGIVGVSRAAVAEKNMDAIFETAAVYLQDTLLAAKTFKVEAKRSDKKFPLKSPEISRDTGGFLIEKFPHLKVDVHNPEVTVTVEIRDENAYIRANQLRGAGGMPTGSAGRGVLMISGGIDSPVAGYMMAKRGVELIALHFASPPYTGERAEMKVKELLRRVSRYAGRITLFTLYFAHIQESINEHCQEDYAILLLRRFMMRAAGVIASREKCGAIVTGESLGQVASQTMNAINCTNSVAELPVFRPLIGMDKEEIISVARRIGTFDISVLPYEDCCTAFVPRHPRTKPELKLVEEQESKLDVEGLLAEALENLKIEALR